MGTYIDVAVEAARSSAELLKTHFRNMESGQIQTKQRNDFVSFVDSQSEQIIRRAILEAFPDHQFVGEEQGLYGVPGEWKWIVDPLDGTSNFVHGIPQFAISIALLHNDEAVTAVVLDPIRDELYTAERGEGTRRNGTPVAVADDQPLSDILMGTGFPFRAQHLLDDYMATFREVFPMVAGVRRMGSAALDLAYVASGELGGFWEFVLAPWDIAAGALLIEEAGGVITDFLGEDNYLESGNVLTGAPDIHAELLEVIQTVLSETGSTAL